MIEIAEAYAFAKHMTKALKGLTIVDVKALASPHKFCWLSHDPVYYEEVLSGLSIVEVTSSAHYLRILLSNDEELAIAEEIQLEYKPKHLATEKHQLQLTFHNDYVLEFKVKLYGFLLLGSKSFLMENYPYYRAAIEAIPPFDSRFTYDHFIKITQMNLNKGSVKAALATEQHIVGLGNGTLQDILFDAKISPKRKIESLSQLDKERLYHAVVNKIDEMMTFGGRDTIRNMFGEKGGYEVIMKNENVHCPICHDILKKEAYMGGKVIYCPNCQK